MKKLIIISILGYSSITNAQIGIGIENPRPSSALEVSSTNKGLLIPRMTTKQRTLINSPADGLIVFQTDSLRGVYVFDSITNKWSSLMGVTGSSLMIGQNNQSGASNNLVIGKNSLQSNTDGFANLSLGNGTLYSNTTGYNNIGIGNNSGMSNKIGNFNISIGVLANFQNTASENIAIGYGANYNLTNKSSNIAIGNYANFNNNSNAGSVLNNIAIGNHTMEYNNSYRNIAIGDYALQGPSNSNNTWAASNISIGYNSMKKNFSGTYNIAIGEGTLENVGYNDENTAIGSGSLRNNYNGNLNVSIGFFSQSGSTTGTENTSVGSYSLGHTTTGSYNTAIGYRADVTDTSCNNSIIIGYDAKADKSNQVVLGNSSITEVKTAGTFISQGLRRSFKSVNSDYSATLSDDVILCSGANNTITLPSAADAGKGRMFTIKNITNGSNSVYISTLGGSIDGATTWGNLNDNLKVCTVISDGTDYWVLSTN